MTVSFAGVTAGIVGAGLTEVVEGSNVVKLNVGKDDVLMGSEMLGRTGTSTTLGKKKHMFYILSLPINIKK